MNLLNHLKDQYRARYGSKGGQDEAAVQEKNVLQYIEGCFEVSDQEFIICSPNISCCSSPPLDHDQVPSCSKEKEQKDPEPNEIAYLRNAFDPLTVLPSPDDKDRSSGSSEAESTETRPYLKDFLEGVPLGSPALLLDIETEEEAAEVEEAGTEEKKESYCEKKTPSVELEDECEFLIEESFEGSSSSWISVSQKTQKPDKNIAVSSKREKKAKRVKDGRRKTLDAPLSITKAKTEITSITKRMTNGLQNVSATKEGITVVENESELSVSIQEGRKQMQSQSKLSLMEQDHSFPVHLKPVPGASQWPSRRKKSNKQKLLEAEPSAETRGGDLENYANAGLGAKNLDHVLQYEYSLSQSKESMAEQLSLSKNVMNQVPSKVKSSRKVHKQKSQESITKDNPPEDGQERIDMNMHAKDSASFLNCSSAEHQSTTVLTAPRKPKKTQLQRKPIGATRRKKSVRVSDQSSEEDGSNRLIEKRGKNSTRKFNKKYKVSSVDSGGDTSYRESPCEPHLEKEILNHSKIQRTSKTLELPRTLDAKWNNVSGPVSNCKDSTNPGMSFDEPSSSDESELLENSGASASNSVRHKLILPTNTPNVRRTKRTRLKPLEYWRGERVHYQTTPSGGFVVSGIISPEQTEPKIAKQKRTVKPPAELDNVPDMSRYSLKNISEPAVVLDPESDFKITLKCVNSGSSHLYFVNNENLSIYKYLITPEFSAGKMVLKPLQEKGVQYSYTDTLVFHIAQGKLLLILYDQLYLLSSGDYFYIPPGNIYNIRNLLDKECVILFTQLKGDRPENK